MASRRRDRALVTVPAVAAVASAAGVTVTSTGKRARLQRSPSPEQRPATAAAAAASTSPSLASHRSPSTHDNDNSEKMQQQASLKRARRAPEPRLAAAAVAASSGAPAPAAATMATSPPARLLPTDSAHHGGALSSSPSIHLGFPAVVQGDAAGGAATGPPAAAGGVAASIPLAAVSNPTIAAAVSSGFGFALGQLSTAVSFVRDGLRPFGMVALQGALTLGGLVEDQFMTLMPDAQRAAAEKATRERQQEIQRAQAEAKREQQTQLKFRETERKHQEQREEDRAREAQRYQQVLQASKADSQRSRANEQKYQEQLDRAARELEHRQKQLEAVAQAAKRAQQEREAAAQAATDKLRRQFDCSGMRAGEFHLALIGRSGLGKSTMINLLASFCEAFKSGKIAQPGLQRLIPRAARQGHSDTAECKAYTMDLRSDLRFVLHDTPGFADTHDRDQQHVKNIIDHLQKQKIIHAIVLVMDGTDPLLESSALRTVFQLIQANFPDCLVDHLFVAWTRVAYGAAPSKSLIDGVMARLPAVRNFHNFAFDNGIFAADAQYSQHSEAFRNSLEQGRNLLLSISKRPGVLQRQLNLFAMLREKVCAQVHLCLQRIDSHIQTQSKLTHMQKQMEEARGSVNANQNYMRTTTQQVFKQQPTRQLNTLCAVCHVTCHPNCGLEETSRQGDSALLRCSCMSDGRCTACPGHCDVSKHFHSRHEFVSTTETLETVMNEVKALYETSQSRLVEHQTQAEQIKASLSSVEAALALEQAELQRKCDHLRTCCSSFNFTQLLEPTLLSLRAKKPLLRDPSALEANRKQTAQLESLLNHLNKTWSLSSGHSLQAAAAASSSY